jgi:hypothetical protein
MQLVVCSNLHVAGTEGFAASIHTAKLLWLVLAVTERVANARRLLNTLYFLTLAQLLLCTSGLGAELLRRKQSKHL